MMVSLKRFCAFAAAAALSLTLCVPAVALTPKPPVDSSKAPVLSTESNREVILRAYAYQPFEQGNIGNYINEVRAEMSSAPVTSDKGYGYTLRTPLSLADTKLFTLSVAKSVNISYMDAVKKASLRPGAKYPAFAVRIAENVITKYMPVNVKATFTARKDVELPVSDADGKLKTLTVVQGAKLVYDLRLNVDYDYLSRLRFVPDYASARVKLKADSAFGVKGELLHASRDGTADYTWKSAADLVCAEVDGQLSGTPKLYTSLTDKNLKKVLEGKTAFYRSFSYAVPTEGTVTLTLENPFLTYEGSPVIPAKQVRIYELKDDVLKDVTSAFRRTVNARNRSAFSASVSTLGTYVMVEDAL